MASTPINTAATGAVTGAVVTVIAAVVKHFSIDLPADAQVSVAVGIVAAAHWLGDKLAARSAAKQPSSSAP